VLMRELDPSVKLELTSTGQSRRRRLACAMQKYSERLALIHIKDRQACDGFTYSPFTARDHFTEAGSGTIDWKKSDTWRGSAAGSAILCGSGRHRPPVDESLRLN